MKNRISSIMDTRKKRLGFVIIGVMLIATVCTGFAFAASAQANSNDNPGRTALSTDSRFIDNNGQSTPVNNPQVFRSEMFRIGDDGKLTPDRDEMTDNFLDKMGIPFMSQSILDREEGAEITFGIFASDGTCLAGDPALYNNNAMHAQSMYTEEELAQIIAEIESGKRLPNFKINDNGTIEVLNMPEGFVHEGAVSIDMAFLVGDECIVAGSLTPGN